MSSGPPRRALGAKTTFLVRVEQGFGLCFHRLLLAAGASGTVFFERFFQWVAGPGRGEASGDGDSVLPQKHMLFVSIRRGVPVSVFNHLGALLMVSCIE